MVLTNTPICDFNWPAPDFTLPDAHGKSYALQDLKGEKGVMIMFICNHCPYVIAIAPRLQQAADEMAGFGITTIAINANDWQNYPADAPDKMPEFVKQYGFHFPYLIDESQEVAKAFDAVCTPDFFGFNADLGLQYRGRFDSAGSGKADENTLPDMVNAMRQVANTGQGPAAQTPSMGCSIKWRF